MTLQGRSETESLIHSAQAAPQSATTVARSASPRSDQAASYARRSTRRLVRPREDSRDAASGMLTMMPGDAPEDGPHWMSHAMPRHLYRAASPSELLRVHPRTWGRPQLV